MLSVFDRRCDNYNTPKRVLESYVYNQCVCVCVCMCRDKYICVVYCSIKVYRKKKKNLYLLYHIEIH